MINKLITFTIAIFFLLFPLFFLTTTSESYEYNKMFLLVVTTTLLFFLYNLKVVRERKFSFTSSTFSVSLFFLAAIFALSTLLQSPNITLALTTPLSTSTIFAGFLLYLLLVNEEKFVSEDLRGSRRFFIDILIIAALLLALYSLLLYTGILPKNFFTPAGTILTTTTFLAVITIYLLAKIVPHFLKIFTPQDKISEDRIRNRVSSIGTEETLMIKEKESGTMLLRDIDTLRARKFLSASEDRITLYFLALLLIGSTTVFLIIQLFTSQKPILLPFSFGWMILLEVLKNLKTALLGIGPANFITAFTLGKPLLFNQSPLWNVTFTSSSSFFLNIATEVGMIGGIFYSAILLKSLKLLKLHTTDNFPIIITLIFTLIIQLLLPANLPLFTTTIILLAFAADRQTTIEVDLSRLGKTIYLFLVPSLILAAVILYFGGRAYLSEMAFKRSLDALVNNDGTSAYNFQKDAITLNPYLDRYHTAFSQTNLALANALAGKSPLTEEDKQNIPRLVQQAIDHARTAVVLHRTNVVNWDNLARIYSALSSYAQDANIWAARSYEEKIALDPLNPLARLSFGGFYLSFNKYPEAENLFRETVRLKPDFANGHFNLGVVLREQKKYQEAYLAFQNALSQVAPNSTDSAKIQEELKLIPQEFATGSPDLKSPVSDTQTLEPIESTPSSSKLKAF